MNTNKNQCSFTRSTLISACRKTALAVVALSLVSAGSERAPAAVLYATSIGGSQIDKVDTVANTVTTYLNTPSAADSIMFDPAQRVLYTQLYTGQVRRYDPTSLTDSLIASGFNGPADIVLEPGGNTMLVSEFYGAKIDRINLTTFGVTTLLTTSYGGPEGLAYVGTRLFANLGNRYGGPTGKYVAEIDPVTGAILSTSPGLDSLDGLTYDPYSGRLYASSLLGNYILSINPNNLNDVQNVTGKLGIIPGPDGITTDSIGNLFIAGGGDSYIYQLDLVNNILTQNTFVFGLDDLAPASGLGSLSPEPSASALMGLGLAGLLGACRRMKK
jgi:streptogramin lyase